MTTTTSTSRRSSSSDDARSLTVSLRDGGEVHVRCSTRDDGDFHRLDVPFGELEARRRAFVDLPWTMLDEHHGVGVRRVTEPGEHDGAPGDVAVTAIDDAVLGCWVGDCAPVVLVGGDGDVAVAHAGWRGLAAGVLDVAAGTVGALAHVALGPVIGPCCYEFGRGDLERVAAGGRLRPDEIAGRTTAGGLALDVGRVVDGFATRLGTTVTRLGGCTGCAYPGFSHRVRRDPQRHVVAVWRTTGGRS